MTRAWPVHDVDPDASAIENARRVLAVRVAEFYSFEPIIPYPELSAALHDLRISTKRLRYTLELFRPQFGKAGQRQIERVKMLQEELGTLHDHDVRIELIGDELSQLMLEQSRNTQSEIADASSEELGALATAALRPPPDDPRRGLIALLGREHAGRRAAYARFRELWDTYAGDGMRRELVALSVTPLSKQLPNAHSDSLV
ncbi:MAG TPA: CHAD domain-containing protein [Thermomicrobiales bacterium]|nr:CHAD domain-containing protein [Thermomicrobiales bacterium]